MQVVCLCGVMYSTSAWTSLMHCFVCSHPSCVIVGTHIGSGAAWWLPREPLSIPRQIPEMAIKKNFTLLFFCTLSCYTTWMEMTHTDIYMWSESLEQMLWISPWPVPQCWSTSQLQILNTATGIENVLIEHQHSSLSNNKTIQYGLSGEEQKVNTEQCYRNKPIKPELLLSGLVGLWRHSHE